jgi:hypothetical protein
MVPELRPRGIGEMLDAAVGLYRARWTRLVLLAAIVVIPVQVINTLVLLSAQPDHVQFSITGQQNPQFSNALLSLAAQLTVLFVDGAAGAFVAALCAKPCAEVFLARVEDRESVSLVRAAIPAALAASILVSLCNILGFAACFVGYLAALALLSVTMPALVVERLGPAAALGRSLRLAQQHFWRSLGVVITAAFLASVVNLGLASVLALVVRATPGSDSYLLIAGLSGAVTGALTQPFTAAVMVVLYFDLRIRNEGFDVQLLMQRNDARYAA